MQARNKPLQILFALIRGAIRAPGQFLRFLNAWLWTRRVRLFVQGLPAVAVAGVLIVVLIIGWDKRDRSLAGRYHTQASKEFESDDLDAAKLLFRKLSYLQPDLPHGRYGLALCAQKEGQLPRTLSLMQSVAPADVQGFGPAHFWMSQWLIAKSRSQEGPEKQQTVKLVEHHLAAAIEQNPMNQTAHELLGRIQLGQNDLDGAAAHLAIAAEDRPAVDLTLARTYWKLNKSKLAQEAAERALRHYKQQVEANPENLTARLALVDAGLICFRYRSCIVALADGIEHFAQHRSNDDVLESSAAEEQQIPKTETSDNSSGNDVSTTNATEEVDESVTAHSVTRTNDNARNTATAAKNQSHDDSSAQLKILSSALARVYNLWSVALWPPAERVAALAVERQIIIQRRKSRAMEEAKRAVADFTEKSTVDPKNVLVWLRLAECEVLLLQFEQATNHLSEGIVYSHDDRLIKRLAATYVSWAMVLANNPQATAAQNLDVLLRARRHASNNQYILTRLASLTGTDTPESDKAMAALQDVLKNGKAPFGVHFVLGNNALAKQDFAAARKHLEKANKLSPGNAVVLNNLAWLLANTKPPDYPRALEVANAAVKKLDNPEIRETRGQILAKMKRWQDALADLKLALATFPKRLAIHAALATVYQNLDQPDLAQRHRQLSGTAEPVRRTD